MSKIRSRAVVAAAVALALVALVAAPASAAKVWTTYWSGSVGPNITRSSHSHALYGAQAHTDYATIWDCANPDCSDTVPVAVYAQSTTVTLGSQSNTVGPGGTAQILRTTPITTYSTCKHGPATLAEVASIPLKLTCRIQTEGKLTTPARAGTPESVALAAPYLPAPILSTETARTYRGAEVYRAHLVDGSECLIASLDVTTAVSCSPADRFAQYGLSMDLRTDAAELSLVVPVNGRAQTRSSQLALGAGVFGN